MDEHAIREMVESDETELAVRIAALEQVLQRHYGKATRLTGKRDDLALLQRALDDRLEDLQTPVLQQHLGLAFGNVLANELGLRWVIVEDDYGADPALQHPSTEKLYRPQTMIAARLEDDARVDLQKLAESYAG